VYTLVRRRPFTPPQLAGFTCAALALFVAVVCGARLLGATAANEDIASATAPATLSLRAPTSAQASAASARLGLEQAVYHVDDLDAVNPAEGLSTRFGRGAVTVSTGKAQLRLSVSSFGHPGAMRALAAVAPRAGIAGATYPHPDLVESYANGPLGLEQSFVVATRPAGSPGSLTVSIATAGSFQARLAGTRVVFSDGRSQLTYGGLSAVDASGRTLASHLALRHGALAIVVDDRGARYPIRIDPYVQGATLFGLGESGRGFFGQSGAISADGSTIMIGAPQDGTAGAAYVYVYAAATGWTQQTELILTKPASAAFGSSVALSSNGDVALIGSPNEGRVYVWARSGTIWTNVAIIAPSVSVTGFGVSVALSANGAIGLIGDNGTTVGTNLSSAFFYDHPDGISYWVGGAPVTPAGEDSNGSTFYPMQVALSSSGATALLGNAGDDGGLGSR
jgi:hypothetical protein